MSYTHLISYEKKIPGTNIWVECAFRTVRQSALKDVKALRARGFRNVRASYLNRGN